MAFFLALSEMNTFLIFQYFVWNNEERLTLHQFQRLLAIMMMFNTYDTNSSQETEESHQHQRKRNRRDVPDAHKLITAPAHTKCYVGKPKYKWDLTASKPYQQRACSAGYGKQT